MIKSRQVNHPALFEEIFGKLHELNEEDGLLIALIGNITLALPIEMKSSMQPFTGKRVAVLHTDEPHRPYLFRVLSNIEINNDGVV